MLQLHNVRKSYTTGDFTQVALDDVSINFRDNEFVAILGPSGSGKTTLLNIVGGLDRYDSGSLVIEGTDTSKYKDRDWDTYRNNRIGFVFQSYNLIPHQSVLANVELALTLSGVSRSERRARAEAALAEVGLAEHMHKKPNQLSGGQMQRVAIARALINDPEIVLADEPTGALDSKTSEQIMELLTQIAQDRLVVMVTHNPELAEEYATRTVALRDGQVEADTDPFVPEGASAASASHRKTSMSFFTAISLSFNNLMTKKGRTLMTAFAGSIGIIGIAAILALANGVNNYIKSVEEDTLSLYPLSIQSQGMDMLSMMTLSGTVGEDSSEQETLDEEELAGAEDLAEDGQMESADGESPVGSVHEIPMMGTMFESVGSNDLAALKVFLDNNGGDIDQHVNSIEYSYNVTPQIFSPDTSDGVRQVNPDTTFAALGFGGMDSSNFLAEAMSTNVFYQLASDTTVVESQYQVVAGKWPSAADELLLVLTPSGATSDFLGYVMGLRDPAELDTMMEQLLEGESVTVASEAGEFTYREILDVTFKNVPASDYYAKDKTYDVWTDRSDSKKVMTKLVEEGRDLRVVGIVQPEKGVAAAALQPGLYYTPELRDLLVEEASNSEIVQDQLKNPATNVFTGRTFAEEEDGAERDDFDLAELISIDEAAIEDAFTFDESQLMLDSSALDFSGMDMPSMELDPGSLPTLGLGEILSGLDVSDMADNIDVEKILAGAEMQDLSSILGDIEVDEEAVGALANELTEEYFKWALTGGLDPSDAATNFPLFLESEQAQKILDENQDLFKNVEEQLTELQAETSKRLIEGISAAVQEQLEAEATQISSQVEGALTAYMGQAMGAISAQVSAELVPALEYQIGAALEAQMSSLAENMSSAMGIDQEAFANAFQFDMDEEELGQLLVAMMSTSQSSLDGNLAKLGYADYAKPSGIDIYPKDFEGKSEVIRILDGYNAEMAEAGQEDKVITYTDIVGALMSSVTDIINVISYVLVAFVAISLVVSSIMIGVITYISVLERKKEIGILRSIGASKRDIRWVFNAETLIVGFVAGLLGILITVLLTIPVNAIVYARFGIANVAVLPVSAAVVLVLISMGLTFLAGLIPSSAASRKDPVEALRSE